MSTATPPRTAVFRAVDIAKIYQMGEVKVHALRGVSLELYEHEFVVLLGASGSGKSRCSIFLAGWMCQLPGPCIISTRN